MATQTDFFLYLNIDSLDDENAFKNILYQEFVLDGQWECALCDFTYTPIFQVQGRRPREIG